MANERVLVIDDGKDIRDFVVNYVLIPNGYEVLIAKDGAEGLQKALTENPDFIVCDMQMPHMSGLEVLQTLSEQGKNIPSILMTAFGSEELAIAAFRAGARDYLIKPFAADDMLNAISRTLQDVRRHQERENLTHRLIHTTQQLENRLRELNTLIGIGKSVTSLLDLEMILNRVVEAGVFMANADESTLLLLDDTTQELYIRASKNFDSKLAQTMRLKVQDSLAGQVIHSGEPLLVGDKGWRKIKTRYLVRSLLYVPLKVKDRVIGVLGVANKIKDAPFTKRDQQLLAALADYAAIAIENARLFASTEAERSKLDAILRQTEDLVIAVDPDNHLILVNKSAQAAFQMNGRVIGKPIQEAIDFPDLVQLFDREHGSETTRRSEVSLDDGRIFNAHVTKIPGVGQAAVLRDITHLKELDRIKSEFVSVVSHDLRSPLTAILGYVELLSRAGPINEMQSEFIQRVQHSVQNITTLIGDLLDLGRIEAGFDQEMESYHLTTVIRDVLEGLRPNSEVKQLTLDVKMAPHLPANLGNPLRLRQAIHNLVENAIKYTPEGGLVSIEVLQEQDQIVMRVADSGVGISPADQPYIFDKFYRSESVADSHAGTGLGLSIVKSVLERHHGRIWVDSETGKGTTFTMVLPLIDPNE